MPGAVRCLPKHSSAVSTRAGGRAAAYEAWLYRQPWGFAVEDVPTDTWLWYGRADGNVPASVGRWLADRLPRSHYTLWPQHGHFTWATSDEVGDVMTCFRPRADIGL